MGFRRAIGNPLSKVARGFLEGTGLKKNQKEQRAEEERARAEKERREAAIREAELQQRIANVRARAQRVQAIREARILRSETQADADKSGVSVSSSADGALGSIRTKFGSSLSASRFQSAVFNEISASNIRASRNAQSFLDQAGALRRASNADAAASERLGQTASYAKYFG